MSASRGTLATDRVLFDCPKCGMHHDGPLTIDFESEAAETDIDMFDIRYAFVRQTLRTSACGDAFVTRSITSEPTWNMTLTEYADDRPTRLDLTLAR